MGEFQSQLGFQRYVRTDVRTDVRINLRGTQKRDGGGRSGDRKVGPGARRGTEAGGAGFIGLGLYVRTHVRTAVYVRMYVSGRSETSLMAASFFAFWSR